MYFDGSWISSFGSNQELVNRERSGVAVFGVGRTQVTLEINADLQYVHLKKNALCFNTERRMPDEKK